LISALKTGRRIRRKDWGADSQYHSFDGNDNFLYSNVLADDWEVEEEKITITKSQFMEGVLAEIAETNQYFSPQFESVIREGIARYWNRISKK